ncbi:MAG: response regulator, partial [Lachnospiraceae bacterium]|nr:response regulator [Lachnospiraceae bacterium]
VEQQNVELALAKQDADAARHEALAANEAKGKFLAHMSHEIRTPINAVLGMDEMILREAKEPAIREYAMDIYTAGQTLLSLINDILDFSKIESGKMEIVPVAYDISSLIHDLANMTAQRAKNKDIKLEVQVDSQIPCQLYGDDVRIRQVLTNILTNAVKYTREGTVWLRVNCAQTDGIAALTFEVEDTGIGIRKEDLPKLSAEFERIEEDRNRNIEGTGLGMSITIQLLSLLGSRLQVESVYGKGSRFYFELKQEIVDETPIGDFEARVQRIAEDYHYSARLCAPDAKILVVDDNAVNRRVLRGLLKETRIQVSEAESGAQCLALVQENHYDLIFLDHMMPEMDGVEALHRIKALQDFPCQGTPVVVLTANAVSGAREHYLSEGFDDFLSKPIVPEKLENLIKKMLPEKLLAEAEPQEASASPAEILEEFPPVDGLDWQYAWMHLPDRELLEYTVKEFYAQIDSAADRLEQAYGGIIDAGQLAQYRIQVHAMKGLAATVGILPLSGVARLLESAAREGRLEVIASVTPVFLEEWRSYSRKLQGVFGIGSAVRTQINDTSVILALLEMLRLSMQELDIDKADQLMGQLQSYEYPKETKQSVRRLAEAVTNLDSAGADAGVEALMEQFRSVETWTDSDSEERNAP